MASGVLALLGSGETAPGMTKVHRKIFARIPDISAVNLDTAYGFQLNVPQMSEKLEEYFDKSLHVDVTTLHFSFVRARKRTGAHPLQTAGPASQLRLCGPGKSDLRLETVVSPPLRRGLAQRAGWGRDAVLCLCGRSHARSVHGAHLRGLQGRVLRIPTGRMASTCWGASELTAWSFPISTTTKERNYDTRFCYLGEPRLLELERQLPEGVATLGVDEHTAAVLDFNEDTLTVHGRSNAYWRLNGDSKELSNGTITSLADLRATSADRGASATT